MTPYQKYISYFEDIANRHPAINWFYELDEEEILQGLRNDVQYPCMFLEIPEISFADNGSNTDSITPVGLVVLSACAPGDQAEKRDTLISHEAIIFDIIRQMREDDRTGQLHLNTNQVTYAKVGPHFENCYGWRLDARLQLWADLHYKEENYVAYNPNKFA